MELQHITQQDSERVTLEKRATVRNGQVQFYEVPVIDPQKQPDLIAIRKPGNAAKSLKELLAQQTDLENQLQTAKTEADRLKAEIAGLLMDSKPTTEATAAHMGELVKIEALQGALYGLGLDIREARDREEIAHFEQITATLLESQPAEEKAYKALLKAIDTFAGIVGNVRALYGQYEQAARDLQVNHHLSVAEVVKRGQQDAVNTFIELLRTHETTYKPRHMGAPIVSQSAPTFTPGGGQPSLFPRGTYIPQHVNFGIVKPQAEASAGAIAEAEDD